MASVALEPAFTLPAQPQAAESVSGSWTYLTAKRVTDVVVAMTMLVALAPLFAVIAVLIKLSSPGPVIFAQWRIGKDGRPFRFYKFRSMVLDAEKRKASLLSQNDHAASVTFKMRRDPRVTWIGRIIRKGSIDELPQLWNVVQGVMTLVGPRPAVPAEVAQYSDYECGRLLVTPGLTCLWQVSGRGNLPFDQQVELDLEYIRRRSSWFDLVLLVRTVPAVLIGRGAY